MKRQHFTVTVYSLNETAASSLLMVPEYSTAYKWKWGLHGAGKIQSRLSKARLASRAQLCHLPDPCSPQSQIFRYIILNAGEHNKHLLVDRLFLPNHFSSTFLLLSPTLLNSSSFSLMSGLLYRSRPFAAISSIHTPSASALSLRTFLNLFFYTAVLYCLPIDTLS